MKSKSMSIYVAVLGALFTVPTVAYSQASTWPDKPIRLVIPFAVGGVVDYMGRELAQALSVKLKTPVIIENRGGAAGVIGVDIVARAAPDGYTIGFANGGAISILPHAQKTMPYDALVDLIPVSPVASVANIAVVPAAHPAKNLKELIEIAKQKPDALNYGSSGMGSSDHMATMQFINMTGVKMTNVPYKGGGPAILGLLSGDIDLIISTFPPAMGHIKAGKLRALGVTSATRQSILPDVPTIAEAGVPGYASDAWYGLFVPAKTPAAIINKINEATRDVLQNDPGLKQRLVDSAATIMIQSPAEFKEFVAAESAKWSKLLKAAGVTPK
jgi:tripartite-type tricarboxylate transporter receptor subunit TctC